MKIKNIKERLLSNTWKPLRLFTYDYEGTQNKSFQQIREVYDKGDGAAIFLYNPEAKTVLLTRQFRMPTYINGNDSGVVLEVPAGMLDKDDPLTCIVKEVEEETGFKIEKFKSIGKTFMTPGAVTEITHFFIGQYRSSMRVSEGGGKVSETEDIEVVEMPYNELLKLYKTHELIDAKTLILTQYALLQNLLEE